MGTLIDRVHRDLTEEDITKTASTSHAWRGDKGAGDYEDVAGFCKSVTLEEIRSHGHVLTPGRYVGAEEAEHDDEPVRAFVPVSLPPAPPLDLGNGLQQRLTLLRPLPIVPIDEAVRTLAAEIMANDIMPTKAAADALHVAAAAAAGVQYLFTYNCTYIANARELPRIYRVLDDRSVGQLLSCTPAEFLGRNDEDELRAC